MQIAAPVTGKIPLAFLMPVRLDGDGGAHSWAIPRPTNGWGDFHALAGTDGLVELPPGPDTYPKGSVTRFYRW